MNKEEFHKEVIRVSGVAPETVKHVLNIATDVAAESLSEGIEISIRGFGRFSGKRVASRAGHNPATGQKMVIPEYRKITFTPAKEIKNRLNGK